MTMIINKQQAQPVQQVQIFCEVCGEGHMSNLCPANPESVYFVGNANRGQTNQYGDTYNPNWRNHPNFSWGGNKGNQKQYWPQAPQQQSSPPQAEQQVSLEEMMKKLMTDQQALNQKLIADQQTFNQKLIADQQTFNQKYGWSAGLSRNTEKFGAPRGPTCQSPKYQTNRGSSYIRRSSKEKEEYSLSRRTLVPKPVEGNKKDDKGPEPEVPKYARYLRDIVANKRRHAEFETVALTEECSAKVQSKLPPKLKDPGSFTIPLSLGKQEVGRALCDLGASINLMPSSLFKQLGLGLLRPTTITLQLADRSLVMPEGIIEDVLVRVGKFILPADFIILDYEAYEEVPIILGRPFLATGGVIIDVRAGKLKMRIDDEEVTFNVYKALKLPKHYEDFCMITVVELKEIEQSQHVNYSDPDGTTELEEVVFPAERVKMIEKRAIDKRGDLPRACKKARLHGRKNKRKRPT
uniref:Uncharacterized protein n=1 Tax=Nicotiana tabacum TaxID=4097 RepID=A0A1S3XQY7_TOBAC|nr:PREDICTED: uncharacterized protein LOC107767721 [Nicotiana tabacum]